MYHDGDDDLATRLAPDIARALDDGDAVLLCSRPAVWQLVAARLGPASEHVEYVPGAVRYGHPNVSMRILHDFVRDQHAHSRACGVVDRCHPVQR